MSIFNETECADVNGECRFVKEMNLSHFLSITGVMIVIVLLLILFSYSTLSLWLFPVVNLVVHLVTTTNFLGGILILVGHGYRKYVIWRNNLL